MYSLFLKQHTDEEVGFQSFKDINELIKEMLELKSRNAAVETELNEMQGRYSQLSLQFAEVEGESKVEVVEQEGFAGGGDDRRGGAGMAEDGVGEAGVGGGRHGVFGERMRAGLQVAGQRQSHAPQRYHSRHLKMSFE